MEFRSPYRPRSDRRFEKAGRSGRIEPATPSSPNECGSAPSWSYGADADVKIVLQIGPKLLIGAMLKAVRFVTRPLIPLGKHEPLNQRVQGSSRQASRHARSSHGRHGWKGCAVAGIMLLLIFERRAPRGAS